MGSTTIFVVFAFGIVIFGSQCIAAFDEIQTINWLQNLTNEYASFLTHNIQRQAVKAERLKQIYQKLQLGINVVNTTAILNNKLNNIQDLFHAAEDKVQFLADAAERHYGSFNHSKQYTAEEVAFYSISRNTTSASPRPANETLLYYNAKCSCAYQLPVTHDTHDCVQPAGGLSPSEDFLGVNVSFASSAVHVPLDVYIEAPDVLKDVAWTQELDDTFQKQSCSNASAATKWSYVATENGVMRYFPARSWNLSCSLVDVYDARSEQWFLQSVSSPKDILVMIDTSGSVVGLTLSLTRHSVRHLMNTLTENDYFNIFVFNDSASFIEQDCPGLIQAVPRMKELASGWLDKINAGNPSSFEKGFDFAFSHLRNSSNSTKPFRASCNPMILLLTDGGAEYPSAAFAKWNLNKETRVFTYSVGKHFASTTSLKEMACNNRGQFATIPSNSATHTTTRKYLNKIGKPLAYSNTKSNKWTLPYEDHLGLGGVMSLTRPVYGTTESNRVVAVAGVDILHDDIKMTLDLSQYGAHSYMFGIENNGFLFHHPELMRGRLSSAATVDVSEIEHMNVSEIRRSMIEEGIGSKEMERLMLSKDGLHLYRAPFKYSYAPVPDSLFSLSTAFPTSSLARISSRSSSGFPANISALHLNRTGLSSTAYGVKCATKSKASGTCQRGGSPMSQLRDVPIESLHDGAPCVPESDSEQRADLLLHGWATGQLLERDWLDQSFHNAVRALFVATDSCPALMRVLRKESDQFDAGIEDALSDPSSKDYFRRALLTDSLVYSVLKLPLPPSPTSAPEMTTTGVTSPTTSYTTTSAAYETTTNGHSNDPTDMEELAGTFIIASEAVVLPTDPAVIPAVTGAILKPDILRGVLFNMSYTGQPNYVNCLLQEKLCVVLDDGGALVMTNLDAHQTKVGDFFGSIDGDLMKALERDGLYKRSHVFDYQAICNRSDSHGNSARRSIFVPTVASLFDLGKWLVSSSLLLLHQIFYSFVTSLRSAAAETVMTYEFTRDEVSAPNFHFHKKHCVLRSTVFEFGDRSAPTEGTFTCQDLCNRTYVASRIPKSNLLMVVADASGPCSTDDQLCFTPFPRSELIDEVSADVACPSRRFRKPPSDVCSDTRSFPESLDKECGASQLRLSLSVVLWSQAIIFLLSLLAR